MWQINITSHSTVLVHLQIHVDFQLPHLPSTFVSLAQRYVPYSISHYIWNTSNLLLLSSDAEINPGPRTINQNPVFCSICYNKINWGVQQHMAPTCSKENCNARCHQAGYLSAKLVIQKIPVAVSPGNVLNMALKLPKLLSHLLQFMNFQIVPLLLENLAPFANIFSAPVMLI